MVGLCLQKLPVNKFEWIEDISQFNEIFKKSMTKKVIKNIFFEVDVQYSEKLHELHKDLPFFYQKE